MPTLFWVSYVALWLLLLTVGVLMLLLYRHFGMMALGTLEGVQRDGLPVGSAAPNLSGVTADGKDTTWHPRRGQPHFLLFAAPDCEPCGTILPYLNQLAEVPGEPVAVTAIVPGPQDEIVRLVDRYHPTYPSLAEDGSGAFHRYRVRVTPFGFVIGGDGRVLAKGLCGDVGRLRQLLEAGGLDAAAASLPAPALPIPVVRDQVMANNGGSTDWHQR
jgi:methylamine dehydrogenase accessory protein MauD